MPVQDNSQVKNAKAAVSKQAMQMKNQALDQVSQLKDRARTGTQQLVDIATETATTYLNTAEDELLMAKKGLVRKVKAEPLNALLVAGAVGFIAGLLARGK